MTEEQRVRQWINAIEGSHRHVLEVFAASPEMRAVINRRTMWKAYPSAHPVTPLLFAIRAGAPWWCIELLVLEAGAIVDEEVMGCVCLSHRWQLAYSFHLQGARVTNVAYLVKMHSYLDATRPKECFALLLSYREFWDTLELPIWDSSLSVNMACLRRRQAHARRAAVAILSLKKRGALHKDVLPLIARRLVSAQSLQSGLWDLLPLEPNPPLAKVLSSWSPWIVVGIALVALVCLLPSFSSGQASSSSK